jgi:choline-sulfatase
LKKPNIVFLFADQLRFDALGCNGNKLIKTPNIDSIASDGMNFNHCFSPVSLCSPARACVFTGLHAHNHGQLANLGNFNNVFDRNVLDKENIFKALKSIEYNIGYNGKWHLPNEKDSETWGIDKWNTTSDWLSKLRDEGTPYEHGKDDVQRLEWTGDAPFHGKASLKPEQMHEVYVADKTIEMMEQYSKENKPFMITSAFFGPHFPIAVPEPYNNMYDSSMINKWGNFHDMFEGKPLIQQKEILRWNASHLTWPDWQKVIACYWGFCTFIDDQIRRILGAIQELGIEKETIIIFSCDHGDMLGSHRMFNKGMQMYDETHHIPFLVKYPEVVKPNSKCDEFISLVDFMPTLLDIAGISSSDKLDGSSILPLLHGDKPDYWRDDILCEFHGYESALCTIRMIRTKKWKYIYNPCSADELYDIESDCDELYNLADKLAFKHVLRRMKIRMLKALRETTDSIVDQGSWQSNSYDLFISPREK